MDRVDAAILEFAWRWLPYGGPTAEDILIEFGMTTARYEQQLLLLLDSEVSRSVPPDAHARLRIQLVGRRVQQITRSRAALSR
ncbi:DUF3263 domain-containing protein [Rhodococcus sp. T7]|uniref:DUF3263 domain-containing protein n=1 Tax=Rhodococcus sp. T7 TaxID=627444 RepID=UPI0013586E2D|nr:DUF3263 domain-containing protein [Rhodococcus sp. T7]